MILNFLHKTSNNNNNGNNGTFLNKIKSTDDKMDLVGEAEAVVDTKQVHLEDGKKEDFKDSGNKDGSTPPEKMEIPLPRRLKFSKLCQVVLFFSFITGCFLVRICVFNQVANNRCRVHVYCW